MQVLARQGHRYIVTALGAPKAELLAHDLQACGVAAFEVNATLDGFARQRSALRALRTSSGAQVYYAKILTFDDSHFDGKHFSHFVKAGFTPEELAEHEQMILSAHRAGEIDGVTVRIEAGQSLVAAAATLKAFHAATGCLVLASLKLSGPSLAIERADDRANVASVAEAMILSKSSPGIRYVYDTFMDVDRGYFPRHAFIDRRFNPRPAATAFTTLNALLSSAQTLTLGAQTHDAGLALAFKADAQDYVLIRQTTSRVLDRLGTLAPSGIAYDLVAGERCSVASQMKTLQRALDGEGDGPLQVVLVRL